MRSEVMMPKFNCTDEGQAIEWIAEISERWQLDAEIVGLVQDFFKKFPTSGTPKGDWFDQGRV